MALANKYLLYTAETLNLHRTTINLIPLPDGSYPVSDIQDYFECIIKNMKL